MSGEDVQVICRQDILLLQLYQRQNQIRQFIDSKNYLSFRVLLFQKNPIGFWFHFLNESSHAFLTEQNPEGKSVYHVNKLCYQTQSLAYTIELCF